jgi:hypothetical protein
MKNILKNIEEKMTLLQQEIHHLSDEVYNQQKEILELKLQIKIDIIYKANFPYFNSDAPYFIIVFLPIGY